MNVHPSQHANRLAEIDHAGLLHEAELRRMSASVAVETPAERPVAATRSARRRLRDVAVAAGVFAVLGIGAVGIAAALDSETAPVDGVPVTDSGPGSDQLIVGPNLRAV